MSEVKKIATRESYGNALVELGKEHEDLVVLDADLAEATKTVSLPQEKFRLQVHLLCLQQDVHLSRFATQSDIQN